MNFKTFVFMILTFRRVDPIPKNIGLMLSITFWISIVWIGSSPTPIRRRRKTSGVSIWMWMILCINIITDNENKKDRMIIAYPSLIM